MSLQSTWSALALQAFMGGGFLSKGGGGRRRRGGEGWFSTGGGGFFSTGAGGFFGKGGGATGGDTTSVSTLIVVAALDTPAALSADSIQ